MILWRKGLKIKLDLFYSLRNLGSWSKRRYIVTIASAACWSISDYNIDPQKDIPTQNTYSPNIFRLTIIVIKKILKPTISRYLFSKKAWKLLPLRSSWQSIGTHNILTRNKNLKNILQSQKDITTCEYWLQKVLQLTMSIVHPQKLLGPTTFWLTAMLVEGLEVWELWELGLLRFHLQWRIWVFL